MKEDISNEKSIVAIDELHLDKECVRLPSDYLRYAHASADAKRDVDDLKSELTVLEADLARKIRTNPEEYGLEKVTESAIKELILVDKEYSKAMNALAEAKHRSDLVQALVSALEVKKRSLTLLVDLHGMGYFAQPRVSEAGKEAVAKSVSRKNYDSEDVRGRRRNDD